MQSINVSMSRLYYMICYSSAYYCVFDSNNDDDTVNRETNHGVIINPNGEIMAFGFVRSHDYFSNSVNNFLCLIE